MGKQLYNKIDSKILKAQMENDQNPRTTISFYKYARIGNVSIFRDFFYQLLGEVGTLGRVYVAHEGVNAQVSVPTQNLETFRDTLDTITFLEGCRLNTAVEDDGKSFYKLKVKIKDKIVADGLDDASFDVTNGGKHLSAEEFNKLTDDEKTVLIDMRNHYESEVGHFEGAITPDVDTFRDSLPIITDMLSGKEDQNIVMYCTGGIRCEKASAWFKHQGFENVHQLDGGIIEYAREAEAKGLKNKFRGKNFVFDERLGEKISDEVIANCHQCGAPCDVHTNCANVACNLLFIQCDSCKSKYENCCSDRCKSIAALPEAEQAKLRKDKAVELKPPGRFFRKGRTEHLKYINE